MPVFDSGTTVFECFLKKRPVLANLANLCICDNLRYEYRTLRKCVFTKWEFAIEVLDELGLPVGWLVYEKKLKRVKFFFQEKSPDPLNFPNLNIFDYWRWLYDVGEIVPQKWGVGLDVLNEWDFLEGWSMYKKKLKWVKFFSLEKCPDHLNFDNWYILW